MEGRFCGCRVERKRQVLGGMVPVGVAAGVVGLWDVVAAALNAVLFVYLSKSFLMISDSGSAEG